MIEAQKEQALNVTVVKNPVYASDSEQEPIRKPTCDTVAVQRSIQSLKDRYIDIPLPCFFVLSTPDRLESDVVCRKPRYWAHL